MLTRMQLFPLNFYKKQKFTGSIGKMNFRLEKKEIEVDEGEKKVIFRSSIWKGPFCYDVTKKEEITEKDFPFSEDGMNEVIDYFNEQGKIYNDPHIL